jgi:hypothetical protein
VSYVKGVHELTPVLVPADAIATGEKLRLRVCDSDRFSADDLVGVVEVDVSELILQAQNQPTGVQQERHDVLQPGSPGMRVQGSLEWSVRFYPLWRMSDAELKKRADAAQVKRAEGCTPAPWWLQWLDRYVEVPAWEKERQLERKATMDRITGDRFRSEVEAAGKPTAELPSGVLQFHIHQCSDLELESLQGTFSGSGNRRKSAANGKPALQDIIDRGPTDNIDPPSTYCEVHLNDKFVYRTRTKQLTPVPYFNAVSERFIRDWREARIVFVVKDARDREHDPTLGIVNLQLKDVLRDRCQITHWYPLLGGLGWGRLRISLLFKPFDMHLPPNISSFETATFDLKGVSTTTDLLELCGGSRFPNLVIESEYDKAKLECVPDQSPVSAEEPYSDFGPGLAPAGPQRARTIASIRSTANASVGASRSKRERLFRRGDKDEVAQPHTGDVEWKAPHHVRLAVLYRPSCSLVFGFTLKRMIKKSKTYALATLRLKDVPDGEVATRTIPIFATSEIRDAMMAARQHDEAAKFAGGAENGQQVRVPSEHLGTHTPLVGYLTVSFVLHSGVSHAHRKLAKRDLRFRSVYRAWESIQIMYGREAVRLADSSDFDSDSDSDSDDNDDSEDNSEDDEAAVARRQLERDDTRHMLDEHDSHNHALHAKNRGIFQLKLVRTGKLVKDKAHAKILSSTTGRLDRRSRGMNHEVEHESQSKF